MLFSFHVFQSSLASTVLCYNGSTHILLIAHSTSRWMGLLLADHHFLQLGVPQGSVLGPLLYHVSTQRQFARPHGLNFYFNADDSQLYITFKSSSLLDRDSSISRLTACYALLILTPGCCVISWNWTRTRQICWSYPLLIDLILPYLSSTAVWEKWHPAHLKLITLVLFLISPFPWFM